jgi:multidrug resistance protein
VDDDTEVRLRKSPLFIVFTTVFVDLVGFGIVLPLLPFYAERFGADAFIVGMLAGSFSLMQFIFAPVWGRLSDRIGRRPVILVSLFASAVSYLIFGLARSLVVLFVSRIFAGIASANIAAAQAYIADITTKEQRAKGMGLIGAAFGLGFMFGPVLGGLLSTLGLSAPGLVASGLCLANMVLAYFRLPESLKPSDSPRVSKRRFNYQNLTDALSHRCIGSLLVLFFITTFAFANTYGTMALFTERQFGYGTSENGYLFAYIGTIAVIIQGGLIGRLTKLFGERRLLVAGAFLMIFGLILIPFAHSLFALLLVLAGLSIGNGLSNPIVPSLISQCSEAEEQGGTLGISQSMSSLARVIGPLWGGFVFEKWGDQYPFISAGIAMILAFVLSLRILANSKSNVQLNGATHL